MNLIVAVTENWGIGCENKLLFRVSEDQRYFKSMTSGKVVVMGHNTFKSLPGGRPLKNRKNIVLSRDVALSIEGVTVCNSIEQLLTLIKNYDMSNVYVIGGEAIYTALLPYCNKAYITKFQAMPSADTFFPNVDEMPEWEVMEEHMQMEYDGLRYKFYVYERRF